MFSWIEENGIVTNAQGATSVAMEMGMRLWRQKDWTGLEADVETGIRENFHLGLQQGGGGKTALPTLILPHFEAISSCFGL